MKEFVEFPSNGFYVVTEPFETDNMKFIPMEVVGIIKWSDSRYVRITKTGERWGGWANYMEVEFMEKLQWLSFEKASKLTNGRVITTDCTNSLPSFTEACELIINSAEITLTTCHNDAETHSAFEYLRVITHSASKTINPESTSCVAAGSDISQLIQKHDWPSVLQHQVFQKVIIPITLLINGDPRTEKEDRLRTNTYLCYLASRFPNETKGLIEPSIMALNLQV